MPLDLITFADKEGTPSDYPANRLIRDVDANEIKAVTNAAVAAVNTLLEGPADYLPGFPGGSALDLISFVYARGGTPSGFVTEEITALPFTTALPTTAAAIARLWLQNTSGQEATQQAGTDFTTTGGGASPLTLTALAPLPTLSASLRAYVTYLRTTSSATPSADTTAPTAPGQPVASNITSSGATLTWPAATDNVAVTGYNVYNATNQVIAIVTGATTRTLTGLTPSTAYAGYYVKAFDAANNLSAASPSVGFTTAAGTVVSNTPPNGYTGIVITSGSSLVDLALSGSAYAPPYLVYSSGWAQDGPSANYVGDYLSYNYANPAAYVEIKGYFPAGGIDYLYTKGPDSADLVLSIDGVNIRTLDSFASSDVHQQAEPTGPLAAGEHTIRWTKTGSRPTATADAIRPSA